VVAEAVTRVAVEATKAAAATAVVAEATVVVEEATAAEEEATAVEATNRVVMEAAATKPKNILPPTCTPASPRAFLNILLSTNVGHFLSL